MAGYEEYLQDPVWVKRAGQMFDAMASFSPDGKVNFQVNLAPVQEMRRIFNITDAEAELITQTIRDYWRGHGFSLEQEVTRDEYIQGMCQLRKGELERKAKGETPLLYAFAGSFFDILDRQKDQSISLEELTLLLKCYFLDTTLIPDWFRERDMSKSGRIHRNEWLKSEFDFWYRPNEEASKGMLFNGQFSGH